MLAIPQHCVLKIDSNKLESEGKKPFVFQRKNAAGECANNFNFYTKAKQSRQYIVDPICKLTG